MNNKATDWFNEVPSVPDPWQDNKPKLTQKEIENAAEIYRTFVDPVSQNILYHVQMIHIHHHNQILDQFRRGLFQ